jgi:hypothetical protein
VFVEIMDYNILLIAVILNDPIRDSSHIELLSLDSYWVILGAKQRVHRTLLLKWP